MLPRKTTFRESIEEGPWKEDREVFLKKVGDQGPRAKHLVGRYTYTGFPYMYFFFIKEVIQFAEPVFFGTSFFGKSFFIGTSLVAQKKRVLLLK